MRIVYFVLPIFLTASVWAQNQTDSDVKTKADSENTNAESARLGLETQDSEPGQDKTKLPLIEPKEEDPQGRDKDRMQTEGVDNEISQALENDPMVTQNQNAIIQGNPLFFPPGLMEDDPSESETTDNTGLPDVQKRPTVIPPTLNIEGFVLAEMLYFDTNYSDYAFQFLPRELEIDFDIGFQSWGRARVDLNYGADYEPLVESSHAYEGSLTFDRVVEQAYVEFQKCKWVLRLGRFESPIGLEPVDPVDRVSLHTSHLTRFAIPSVLTGVYASYSILSQLDTFAFAVNGWDTSIDDNRSKTVGIGFPHRLLALGKDQWLYQGTLSLIWGVEQEGINHQRWLFDYSAQLHLLTALSLDLELIYGTEKLTLNNWHGTTHYFSKHPNDRMKTDHQATWYGGLLSLVLDGSALEQCVLKHTQAEIRFEYLHDQEAHLGLPFFEPITTLLGLSTTLRYEVIAGIEAIFEYSLTIERADVKRIEIAPLESKDNLLKGFRAHELIWGLLAKF